MRSLILALSAFALAAPLTAQTPPQVATAQPAPAYESRAQELIAILAGTGDYDSFFTPGFRTAVPKDKFLAINGQLTTSLGKPLSVARILAETPYTGIVHIRFEKAVMAFSLSVDPAEPHQASGLRVKGVVAEEKSLAEVTATLDQLPGVTSYAFAKLGTGKPELTVSHNPDQALAVGSAFKLVILAELVRQTNAGTRKWDDMVTLDGRQLPVGGYTAKPKGTQVSLRELATQMISVSDNSATDILLTTLGREKVEAMLDTIGVKRDPRNRPFLATLEAFKLKWLQEGTLADKYNALDEKGQRAMLAGEIAAMPYASPAGPRSPRKIETIEWFFTPGDLILVMDWLRRNSEGPNGADARAVLSKSPGPLSDKTVFSWTGFKGGSEPGVINLTALLQATDGSWYAVAASWNNSAAPVENERFAGLVSALVKFAR